MKQIKFCNQVRNVTGLIDFYFTGTGTANPKMQALTRTHADYLSKQRVDDFIRYCFVMAKDAAVLEPLRAWMQARGWQEAQYDELRQEASKTKDGAAWALSQG